MPLPMLTACMHAEDKDVSAFIVSSSKKDQSPIILCKVGHQIATSNDLDEELEPPQFFHYIQSAHRMLRRMGYDLCRGEGLNFGKGHHIPLQPFVPKESLLTTMIRYARGWDISLHPLSPNQNLKNLYHPIPQTY